MAYYPDLTPYTYYLRPDNPTVMEKAYPKALNIGWLDSSMPFPQWEMRPEEQLLKRLLAHTKLLVLWMRGFHQCSFCPSSDEDFTRCTTLHEGRTLYLDDGEVLVVGADGIAFRAPVMLYHYITVHGYDPPQVFWDALRVSSPTLGFDLEEESRQDIYRKEREFGDRRRQWDEERRRSALRLLGEA